MVALQHLLDAPVEPLDHPVGLRRLRRGQAVLDALDCAERVELMLACGRPLTQAEEPIRELLAPRHCLSDQWLSNGSIRKNGADTDWVGALQIPQEAARVCGGLGFEDADENPAGRPINRYEEIAARGLIGHSLPGRALPSNVPRGCGRYFTSIWMYPGS